MRRLAAVVAVAVAVLASLTFTACEPAAGSCGHAGSAKATTETDFYGMTRSMAETFVWMRWSASECTTGQTMWTNWHWRCSNWDDFASGNTKMIADSCWHYVQDDWFGDAGSTSFNSATFESHGNDLYGLRARIHAGADGWVYWYCGRTENLYGGGISGDAVCEYNLDY
jgi:hypothetical protein